VRDAQGCARRGRRHASGRRVRRDDVQAAAARFRLLPPAVPRIGADGNPLDTTVSAAGELGRYELRAATNVPVCVTPPPTAVACARSCATSGSTRMTSPTSTAASGSTICWRRCPAPTR
jgi:hypothetical protein